MIFDGLIGLLCIVIVAAVYARNHVHSAEINKLQKMLFELRWDHEQSHARVVFLENLSRKAADKAKAEAKAEADRAENAERQRALSSGPYRTNESRPAPEPTPTQDTPLDFYLNTRPLVDHEALDRFRAYDEILKDLKKPIKAPFKVGQQVIIHNKDASSFQAELVEFCMVGDSMQVTLDTGLKLHHFSLSQVTMDHVK